MEKEQLTAILRRALEIAGTPEADAVLVAQDRNITRFANSSIHQNMSEVSAWLTLRVVTNGAIGLASTTSFDEEELARTAELARESARHAHPIPNFSGLYRGDGPLIDVATFDRATAALPPAAKAEALKAMFDRGARQDAHFAGAYATSSAAVVCGNTHGIVRAADVTSADATVIAIRGEESGFATAIARDAASVDVGALGDEAVGKATLADGVFETLEPGAYDVILEPPAMAEVFEWMNLVTFSGQAYEDGSSFFVGNTGKQMLSESFTLSDDATDPSFLPFPFDLEGLPKRRVALIENGVIRTPVVDKAWADRLGIAPTANCWIPGSSEHGQGFHLAVSPGTATREELIRSTKLGIWVTRFNYVNGLLEPRTALMTGTTRDGTFLIRDGRVAARLPNLRWTQSMTEALSNIEGMTAERRRVGTWFNMFGGTLAPVMKIRGWHFTGVQDRGTVS